MAEPFNKWALESRAWNGTFILIRNGSFSIKNSVFSKIYVNSGKILVDAEIKEGKQFQIKNSEIKECGSLGSSDDGYIFYVHSSTSSSLLSLSSLYVLNSNFISCQSSGKGGVFHLIKQNAEFETCSFSNVSSKLDGGSFYMFLL
jgi:hypothetical protein